MLEPVTLKSKIKKYLANLHTIKRLGDFWRIFHFEEGAQVSSSVEQLYLKTFVSESNLTAKKVIEIILNPCKITYFKPRQWFEKGKYYN